MKKRTLAMVLALSLSTSLFAACADNSGGTSTPSTENKPSSAPAAPDSSTAAPDTASGAEDTISLIMPPVSATFQDQLDGWSTEFNSQNPNLTLKFETAGWEDYKEKLDVQINAGTPPDIAFVENDNVNKYVDSGLMLDISNIASPDMLADFDEGPLNYYRSGEGLYGLPTYVSIQCLGGNKAMLEAAGIDWKKVQKDGWTYEEFREAIKAGRKDDVYGFIFACAGVTAADYLNILVKEAGMPAPFDKDLKYAYTSQNFLNLLKSVREIIDDGSTPKEMGSVDAGKRWNMFLTGQTMIFGKGLANFEGLALANNEKIKANDGTAVENSIETEYVVLPVPTFFGNPQAAQGAIGGYSMFRGKKEPTQEHIDNTMKAMYYMASGKVAAFTCNELYLSPLSESARTAIKDIVNEVPRSPENAEAMATLTAQIAEARPDIPAELGAKNSRMLDEVIIPKFQSLLANEITPEDMYEAVKSAAIENFGEDGIVKD